MRFICVGAWAARVSDRNQWIQADLQTAHRIISVTTQGRSNAHYNQYVKSYYVSYRQDGATWETISTPFEANDDIDTKKTNLLSGNIVARYIRLLPISWNNHISMRFDVTGCGVSGTMPLYTLVKIVPSIEIRKISGHCF